MRLITTPHNGGKGRGEGDLSLSLLIPREEEEEEIRQIETVCHLDKLRQSVICREEKEDPALDEGSLPRRLLQSAHCGEQNNDLLGRRAV